MIPLVLIRENSIVKLKVSPLINPKYNNTCIKCYWKKTWVALPHHLVLFSAQRFYINGQEEKMFALIDKNLETCVQLSKSDGCLSDKVKLDKLEFSMFNGI